MDKIIQKKSDQWSDPILFDPQTAAEVSQLVSTHQTEELQDRFGSSLVFGTAGLRGIIGAGTNRMNVYTVRQATEGLARYIRRQLGNTPCNVVIGYDSRHFSFEFAQTASQVLAAHQIHVFLFEKLCPTPQVSFEVIQRKSIAGIVITASHNPSNYNGYKVYWQHGGQIVPPDDEAIILEVNQVQDFASIQSLDFQEALKQNKITFLGPNVDEAYLSTVNQMAWGSLTDNQKLKVLYTPLHGTGQRLVPPLLQRRGFQLALVHEQTTPDGNFSTVASPNPEDPKAFQRALAVVDDQTDLILTNDPDADRLGVMVQHQGQWIWLNGNQIGILLLDGLLTHLQTQGNLPKNSVIITTIVSTPMVKKIAESYGLQTSQTLTGFKWIWKEACRLEETNDGKFLFGMEESHGFLMGKHCGDKDGVWAAMAFAEQLAILKQSQKTAIDRLNELYKIHGYYLETLETISLPGTEGMIKRQEMMDSLKNQPPTSVAGDPVLRMIDVHSNQILDLKTGTVSVGWNLPVADVLVFELASGNRIIVRPSGTEPKIKYYFQLQGSSKPELEHILVQMKAQLCPPSGI